MHAWKTKQQEMVQRIRFLMAEERNQARQRENALLHRIESLQLQLRQAGLEPIEETPRPLGAAAVSPSPTDQRTLNLSG